MSNPTPPESGSDRGGQLSVELVGTTVVFTLRLQSHYVAMQLYDKACASLNKAGEVVLTIDGAKLVSDAQ